MTELAKTNLAITLLLAVRGLWDRANEHGVTLSDFQHYKEVKAILDSYEQHEKPMDDIEDWLEAFDLIAELYTEII